MLTRAVKRGDVYVLNGMKHFITNAGIAHVNTIFATTEQGKGTRGISAFVVGATSPASSSARSRTRWAFAAPDRELVLED
jgi:alkylation response protein AidB-like acyl-CoA dehydrogenase